MKETFAYELIRPLGGGGFGDVWLAHYKQTRETVALKIMRVPEDFEGDLKARERFMREIEIARLLRHPHILPALDYGYVSYHEKLSPYLVSPYMPGGSLGELMKKAPPWEYWTLPQTADVLFQAADALEYMHTREPRLVHQDVKPGNFLIRWERKPERIVHLYLCDFGISRWQSSESEFTTNLLGTYKYMAPERLYDGRITWTSDLYALAVMAYLFLVGRTPAYLSDGSFRPQPPSLFNPERVPFRQIDEVILRALDPDPLQRYPSVRAFGMALRQAMAGEVDSAEDLTVANAGDTPLPEQPFVVAEQAIPDISPFVPKKEKPPKPEKIKGTPVPFPMPSQIRRELPPLQTFRQQVLYRDVLALPNAVYWSSDGRTLAATFYEKETTVLIGRENGQIESLTALGSASAACWGPGDRLLAVSARNASQGLLRFWDRDAPTEHALTLTFPEEVGDFDWSSQGQLAVWIGQHISLYKLPQRLSPLSQPSVFQLLTAPDLYCAGKGTLRWSPDGMFLAAGTARGGVLCWNLKTQVPVLQWQETAPGGQVYSLAWSPDGAFLAVAFSNRRVVVWDMLNNQVRREWNPLQVVPRMISMSSSHRLVIASRGGDLLFGGLDDPSPAERYPGHWLAAWSPVQEEFVTLDAHKETALLIWGE